MCLGVPLSAFLCSYDSAILWSCDLGVSRYVPEGISVSLPSLVLRNPCPRNATLSTTHTLCAGDQTPRESDGAYRPWSHPALDQPAASDSAPLILLPAKEPTDEASDRSTIPACSDPVTGSGEKTFDLHDSSVSSCVCPLRISALHDPRPKCRRCERREKACSRSWRRHGERLRLLREPRSDVVQSLPVNGMSPRSSRCCEEASLPPP